QHRPAFELITKRLQVFRIVLDVRGYDVIGDDILEVVEPEGRHLRQDLTLVRNRSGENHIERRKTVGGHDEEMLTQVVDVTDFAATVKFHTWKIGLGYRHGSPTGNLNSKQPERTQIGLFTIGPTSISSYLQFSRTETILEIPGSSIVTPYSCEAV